MKLNSLAMLMLITCPLPALAEVELSFYGGTQGASPSEVTFDGDSIIADQSYDVDWEGKPFTAPPYYGVRITYWGTESFGYGLDFAHNKIYATDESMPDGLNRLEFTDGLNTLTVNAYRKWDQAIGDMTPYVGGGLGLSIPHVEVSAAESVTAGFQVTGPAATWVAGASYPITDEWSLFGEYKGTRTQNIGDLETGGTVQTDVTTNALNVGVSFNF